MVLVVLGFISCDQISGVKKNTKAISSTSSGTLAKNYLSGQSVISNAFSYDINPGLSSVIRDRICLFFTDIENGNLL